MLFDDDLMLSCLNDFDGTFVPPPVDEISTGLDSSTTYQIMRCIRNICTLRDVRCPLPRLRRHLVPSATLEFLLHTCLSVMRNEAASLQIYLCIGTRHPSPSLIL